MPLLDALASNESADADVTSWQTCPGCNWLELIGCHAAAGGIEGDAGAGEGVVSEPPVPEPDAGVTDDGVTSDILAVAAVFIVVHPDKFAIPPMSSNTGQRQQDRNIPLFQSADSEISNEQRADYRMGTDERR